MAKRLQEDFITIGGNSVMRFSQSLAKKVKRYFIIQNNKIIPATDNERGRYEIKFSDRHFHVYNVALVSRLRTQYKLNKRTTYRLYFNDFQFVGVREIRLSRIKSSDVHITMRIDKNKKQLLMIRHGRNIRRMFEAWVDGLIR